MRATMTHWFGSLQQILVDERIQTEQYVKPDGVHMERAVVEISPDQLVGLTSRYDLMLREMSDGELHVALDRKGGRFRQR